MHHCRTTCVSIVDVFTSRVNARWLSTYPAIRVNKSSNDGIKEQEVSSSSKRVRTPCSVTLQLSSDPMSLRKVEEELHSKLGKLPTSPSSVTYTDGATMPLTSTLKIFTKEQLPTGGTWPVFRLMDENGRFRDPLCDGYPIEQPSVTPPFPPPTLPPKDDTNCQGNVPRDSLQALRYKIQQDHPFLQSEMTKNALFQHSPANYADTQQSTNTLIRAFAYMTRLRQMDEILQNAQRQGRISFYVTCRGEEAIHIGSAVSLQPQDTIFAQYREAGLLMWRGFSLEQFMDQCFSNASDLGRGRQMPVHYGSRALNYHTISSPVGTQLPHAVGAAYRLKLENKAGIKNKKLTTTNNASVSVCFFGDGCASTSDFHSALNFAATTKSPVVFVCRNNGYAISTSVTEQYAGDGIVSRAYGYGMAGLRVDGNDIFAMSAAIREARVYALNENKPILIEAMTYRQDHHSTSDDSTRYRSSKEVQNVYRRADPVARVRTFLQDVRLITAHETADMRDQEKMAVLKAMAVAERKEKPDLKYLFEDVYDEVPPHLELQHEQLKVHIAKYGKEP